MGAFRYCVKCGEGLPAPTAREDLIYGGIACRSCGTDQGPFYSLGEWLADIDERLRELEAREGKDGA